MAEPLKLLNLSEYFNIKNKNEILINTEPPTLFDGKDGDFYIFHNTEFADRNKPYNQALILIGKPIVNNLSEILLDSELCEALANNTDAVSIMSNNYTEQMSVTLTDNFNDGLNLLSYNCGYKSYLYKDGAECVNITGGWSADGYTNFGQSYSTISGTKNSTNMYLDGNADAKTAVLGSINKINVDNFNKLYLNLNAVIQNGNGGFVWLLNNKSDERLTKAVKTYQMSAGGNQTIEIDISSITGDYYIAIDAHTTSREITVYQAWLSK